MEAPENGKSTKTEEAQFKQNQYEDTLKTCLGYWKASPKIGKSE
jgi:hypothetical protein